MQPFGLFSFLQTLLNNQNTNNEPSNTQQQKVENEAEIPPSIQEENASNEENRQAVLRFLQEHEQRANRTKKH